MDFTLTLNNYDVIIRELLNGGIGKKGRKEYSSKTEIELDAILEERGLRTTGSHQQKWERLVRFDFIAAGLKAPWFKGWDDDSEPWVGDDLQYRKLDKRRKDDREIVSDDESEDEENEKRMEKLKFRASPRIKRGTRALEEVVGELMEEVRNLREELNNRSLREQRENESGGEERRSGGNQKQDSTGKDEKEQEESGEEEGEEYKDQKSKGINMNECMKTLQMWKLSFTGSEKENPERFLMRLQDCKTFNDIKESVFIKAIPCVLDLEAGDWYRAVRKEIETWRDFKKAFRHRFVGSLQKEDIMEELRARTQAKGEKITEYLSCFKLILSYFGKPMCKNKQARIAYRNILPEYRRFMEREEIESLEDIERLGRKLEELKYLDARYNPPPSKERSRIPGAAFAKEEGKIGAAEESGKGESSKKKKKSKKGKEEVAAANAPNIGLPEKQILAKPLGSPINWEGRNKAETGPRRQNYADRGTRNCPHCGGTGHAFSLCPEAECFYCKQKGHYASRCPAQPRPQENRRVSIVSCQLCGQQGVVLKDCDKCKEFYTRYMGNDPARTGLGQ